MIGRCYWLGFLCEPRDTSAARVLHWHRLACKHELLFFSKSRLKPMLVFISFLNICRTPCVELEIGTRVQRKRLIFTTSAARISHRCRSAGCVHEVQRKAIFTTIHYLRATRRYSRILHVLPINIMRLIHPQLCSCLKQKAKKTVDISILVKKKRAWYRSPGMIEACTNHRFFACKVIGLIKELFYTPLS